MRQSLPDHKVRGGIVAVDTDRSWRGYYTPRPDVQVLGIFISDLGERGNMSSYSAQAIALKLATMTGLSP